jgi:hypothetical protein
MFSGGRLKVVALVCLVAVLAIPTLAFAIGSGAPTTSSSASVHLVWTPGTPIKTLGAKISVGGVTHPATVAGNATASTFAYLGDGAWTVVATAKDNSTGALLSSSAWTILVNEAPKFGAVVPGNGQSLTATPSALTVGYSDNTAVTVCTATVNGTAATVTFGATSSSISAAAVVQGVNYVTATIKDAAGNASSKSWSFFNGQANAAAGCTKCHSGADVGLGSSMTASGHNTTENGIIGGKTKFDGSQGVTLTWKATTAFTVTNVLSASSTNGTAAVSVAPGTSFTAGQTGVVNSTWALPTKAVFWPAVNDGVQNAPSTAIKGLNWNSVITCENCHTAFNASGPHGSSANAGLDSNYPGDYSMAELSKQVTSLYLAANTVSPGLTNGTASGIKLAPSAAVAGTTTAMGRMSNANMTDGTTSVICAKCHRLEVLVPGGTGPGTTGLPGAVVTGANTAHNSHHQDTAVGQCVSCHVAITHGWKAPRLLVDVPKYEGTPFVSENAVEDMGTIAGLNNHPVVDVNGNVPWGNNGAAASTNLALSGTVVWDEGQCDACGDHYGNNIRSWENPSSGATTSTAGVPGYTNQADTAVPVRIDF